MTKHYDRREAGTLFDGALPQARRDDPWTSHAAARSIGLEALCDSQFSVLSCFHTYGPMCHDQLVTTSYANWMPRQSESGLRTRTKELVDLGFLQDSGRTVTLPSGRQSIVWEVTP